MCLGLYICLTISQNTKILHLTSSHFYSACLSLSVSSVPQHSFLHLLDLRALVEQNMKQHDDSPANTFRTCITSSASDIIPPLSFFPLPLSVAMIMVTKTPLLFLRSWPHVRQGLFLGVNHNMIRMQKQKIRQDADAWGKQKSSVSFEGRRMKALLSTKRQNHLSWASSAGGKLTMQRER